MNPPSQSVLLHRLAWLIAALTLLLPVTTGAIVTTLKAGMVFSDWPSSDGYNMLASDFVMAEARRDGLYFTPCAWTSLVHNRPFRPQRIRRMVEAGLNVTINTDDPAMFETNLGHGFTTLFESIGWGPEMARRFSLNSVEGSWLGEGEKAALRMSFRKEIAALDAAFGYEVAPLTV